MNTLIYICKYYLSLFYNSIKFAAFRNQWRKKNSHNFTSPNNLFPIDKVSVGKGTYGRFSVLFYGDPSASLQIGSFCSISSNVTFIIDGEHPSNRISTYPYRTFYIEKDYQESISKGPIIIEDDVWFGYGCTILSGVRIGKGTIVGAGSLVTKDIPPYSIVGGVPARVIRRRFPDEIRNELRDIDFQKLDKETIVECIDMLEKQIVTIDDTREIRGKLK